MEPPPAPCPVYKDQRDIPFKRVKYLGKGAFGTVDEVKRTDIPGAEHFARKTIISPFCQTTILVREVRIIQRGAHKHIVKLVSTYVCGGTLGIIMSPVANCDLWVFLQPPQNTGLGITIQQRDELLLRFPGCLLRGIHHIHKSGIVHKDIKANNFLVQGTNILFTDFGISKEVAGPMNTGRPGYEHRWSNGSSGLQRDILFLGWVFMQISTVLFGVNVKKFSLYCGDHPLERNPTRDLKWTWYLWALWLKACTTSEPERNGEAVAVCDLAFFMLEPNPQIRITSPQILRLVSDPTDDYRLLQKYCCRECAHGWDAAHGLKWDTTYAAFKPTSECMRCGRVSFLPMRLRSNQLRLAGRMQSTNGFVVIFTGSEANEEERSRIGRMGMQRG